MNKSDKGEFTKLIAEGFQEVMIPALDNMEKRLKEELASKEDVEDLKREMDTLNRKFDAAQDRTDRHGKLLENHERRIHKFEKSASL